MDRDEWPLTDIPQGEWIPQEELKEVKSRVDHVAYFDCVMATVGKDAGRLKAKVLKLCSSSLKLSLICGVLARCARAEGQENWEQLLRAPLTPRDLQAARLLVFH